MNMCKNGHDLEVVGQSSRGQCRQCRREYQKLWHAANPEKSGEYSRKWNKENPEKAKEQRIRTRSKNAESILLANAAYRASNPEKIRAANKRWLQANPHKPREYGRKRAGIINLPSTPALIGDPCCSPDSCSYGHVEHKGRRYKGAGVRVRSVRRFVCVF